MTKSLKKNITGIILAGGIGSRMGRDKGLVQLHHKPLVKYAVEILNRLTDNLIISTNNKDYEYLGIHLVEDIHKEIGPMGGIYSSLMHSTTDINMIISCDMPFVEPALFEHLIKNMESDWVVLPSLDGIHPEPMCGIYRKKTVPVMAQFIRNGNYKLPDLFKMIPFKMIRIGPGVDFYSENLFMNINSEEELQKAMVLLGSFR